MYSTQTSRKKSPAHFVIGRDFLNPKPDKQDTQLKVLFLASSFSFKKKKKALDLSDGTTESR